MNTKICKKCNTTKNIIDFHKHKTEKDGLRKQCKECCKKTQREYDKKNRELILAKKKNYRESPKGIESRKKHRREYYLKNQLEENKRSRKWNKDNKETHKKYKKEYAKEYYKKNKPKLICRSMLHRALKSLKTKKTNSTIQMLGYSPQDLKLHLENLFKPGMNWDNYGEWHIDHIIPLSTFPKNTPINVVNALSNLQPLWGIENMKKRNKLY